MSTKTLREIFDEAAHWSEEDQVTLVNYAREIEAHRGGIYVMSAGEKAAVEEGIAQSYNGEFATDEDMKSLHKRFGAV